MAGTLLTVENPFGSVAVQLSRLELPRYQKGKPGYGGDVVLSGAEAGPPCLERTYPLALVYTGAPAHVPLGWYTPFIATDAPL